MAQRTCSRCASPAAVQCSRCKRAYCNPDCQRADWRAGHRLECAPPPEGARPASPVEEIESDSDDPVQALADLIVAARAGRTPPPPLPGGYAVGEKVYFTGHSKTLRTGDKFTHGRAGEVAGPATSRTHLGEGVSVMFPGNTESISCDLTQLSRAPPPPLPGGYAVGEKVYYVGVSMEHSSGNKWTHGQSGEVTGPATHQTDIGEGLAVKFAGNYEHLGCLLTQLSRAPPPPLPGGYAVGERVYFTAVGYKAPNGDTWTPGEAGEVTGPVNDEDRGVMIMVKFPINDRSVGCFLTTLSRAPPRPDTTSGPSRQRERLRRQLELKRRERR